jgi:hypothetical protein
MTEPQPAFSMHSYTWITSRDLHKVLRCSDSE